MFLLNLYYKNFTLKIYNAYFGNNVWTQRHWKAWLIISLDHSNGLGADEKKLGPQSVKPRQAALLCVQSV